MADYIRPTPRNPFLGGLADLLEASTSPERTQQMQGIMSMLGVPAVASTLNRMSYGAPLTSGSGGLGGTTRVLPDVLEAAMTVAPMAPAAGQLAKRAVMATKGLPVGLGIKSVDDLVAKYPDVKIDASVNKNDINLSRIVVPKDMRNQGVGTQVMNDLSEYADSIGKRITLTPSSDFGGNVGKLKGFYKELGFVENKGRNKDFSTREAMYREPKPLDQALALQYPQEEAMRLAQQRAAFPVGVSTKEVGGIDFLNPTEYRGSHKAPGPDFGAPLHDLTGGGQMYPADVYSAKAAQYYGTGYPKADKEAFALAQRVRGNPDAEITMYRAVPKDENITNINAGDWVSLSKDYAKTHGESALRGDYKILSEKVKAKDLWTNADSIHEFGYQPQSGLLNTIAP